MDQRVTVPMALPHRGIEANGPSPAHDLPDVLEPDVINTGEVNLMVAPMEMLPRLIGTGVARIGSIAAHVFFIVFVLMPRLFPYQPPTQAQIDMARQQLNFIYMPPDVRGRPTPSAPPTPPCASIRAFLRQIAPPIDAAAFTGAAVADGLRDTPAVRAPPDLPAAPRPQPQAQQPATCRPIFDAPRPPVKPRAA